MHCRFALLTQSLRVVYYVVQKLLYFFALGTVEEDRWGKLSEHFDSGEGNLKTFKRSNLIQIIMVHNKMTLNAFGDFLTFPVALPSG